jgi:hypothetical protein
MAHVTLGEMKDALSQVDFPAGKDEILRSAEQQGATEDAKKALRSLAPVEYGNAEEVIRSVNPEVG